MIWSEGTWQGEIKLTERAGAFVSMGKGLIDEDKSLAKEEYSVD